MKKYEYEIVSIAVLLPSSRFNPLGQEGWELVCVEAFLHTDIRRYIFKREITSPLPDKQ